MHLFFLLLAIVVFAIAAVLCFVGSVATITILGIGFIGLALFAAGHITSINVSA